MKKPCNPNTEFDQLIIYPHISKNIYDMDLKKEKTSNVGLMHLDIGIWSINLISSFNNLYTFFKYLKKNHQDKTLIQIFF